MRDQTEICFLHIGAPKTGSTALQKFLSENRDVLTQLGWEYPDVSLRGYGHHDLAFLLGGGYPKWATPQDRSLEDILAQMTAAIAGKPRIILSSEIFYLFPNPQGIADVLKESGIDPSAVKIVVYLRRQDEMHISWYNQAVKAQGYTGSVNECIAETHSQWDYGAQLARWADTFDRENLIVRPYQENELANGDVCHDFLMLAGLNAEAFRCPEEIPNTRINRDLLEFQRLLNRLPLSAQEKRQFHKQLMELTTATANSRLFDDTPPLAAAERRVLLSEYAEGNAQVAREYLGRDQLFDNKVSADTPSTCSYQGLSLEKLTYILGWLIARRNN